jgi:hypothetical protein
VPAVGTLGNSGTRFLDSPGIKNWDLSLSKNTKLNERFGLVNRFEFFNAFNHTNFGFPNTNISTPTVGRIFGARDAREIQFTTRLNW